MQTCHVIRRAPALVLALTVSIFGLPGTASAGGEGDPSARCLTIQGRPLGQVVGGTSWTSDRSSPGLSMATENRTFVATENCTLLGRTSRAERTQFATSTSAEREQPLLARSCRRYRGGTPDGVGDWGLVLRKRRGRCRLHGEIRRGSWGGGCGHRPRFRLCALTPATCSAGSDGGWQYPRYTRALHDVHGRHETGPLRDRFAARRRRHGHRLSGARPPAGSACGDQAAATGPDPRRTRQAAVPARSQSRLGSGPSQHLHHPRDQRDGRRPALSRDGPLRGRDAQGADQHRATEAGRRARHC